MIKPLAHRILVRRDAPETITSGGIIIPEQNARKRVFGTVIEVGSGRLLDDGTRALDVSRLEPDVVELLDIQVQRFEKGGAQYGRLDLATDPRDLAVEALEEALDLNSYLSMLIAKFRRKTRKAK